MLLAAGSMWPTVPLLAQDANVEGRWTGALTILGSDLGFSVDFAGSGADLSTTMDIPTQLVGDWIVERTGAEAQPDG